MDDLATRLDIPVGDEFDGFEVFVVGGAVRDAHRGMDPEDFDLMAVPRPGEIADPVDVLGERMEFNDPESSAPVFFDSHGREVALPRTEESTGEGFGDFDFHVVSPDTPVDEAVETDLERRDLTVNAMAWSVRDGELFDPHGGREDLDAGVVRHVSDAFREDPLRVVRMARFAPRLDAEVAPETMDIARDVAAETDDGGEGRIDALPIERVTQEFRKVVKQAGGNAGEFFRILDEADALEDTFPTVKEHGVEEVARVVDGAAESGFPAVLAALGDELGDRADAFIDSQDITRQERATVRMGRDELASIRRFDELPADRAVDVFGRINGDRGASVESFVDAADGEDVDREAVVERLEAASQVFENVDGAEVFNREGIDPAEVEGERIGELIAEHRADELAAESGGGGSLEKSHHSHGKGSSVANTDASADNDEYESRDRGIDGDLLDG